MQVTLLSHTFLPCGMHPPETLIFLVFTTIPEENATNTT